MNSALLAMSLSYYYVMGNEVEKEENADQILSTLLVNNMYNESNTRGQSNFINFVSPFILHTSCCLQKWETQAI